MVTFGAAPVSSAQPHNPNGDILLSNPPSDTVQALAFSPAVLGPKTFLVAGSWNAEVRCWDVQANGSSTGVGSIRHDGPVLDVAWSGDGQSVFSAGADRTVKMWQLATNQQTQVAAHDAPIRHVFHSSDIGSGSPALVTGSWDKTLKYWDVRAPSSTPMGTVQLTDKVYAMDLRSPLLVVGTADRHLRVYDMRKPQTPYHEKSAQLKHQIRCLATFPNKSGYAVGSVEGRVSIDHISEEDRKADRDFAFKCHRDLDDEKIIYAVNAISFHEGYSTFSTVGSDGGWNFWDKDNKNRLKQFQRLNQPITATAFNANGSIFAYAVGYDWSRGVEYSDPNLPKYVLLHGVQESEIKGKKGGKGGSSRR